MVSGGMQGEATPPPHQAELGQILGEVCVGGGAAPSLWLSHPGTHIFLDVAHAVCPVTCCVLVHLMGRKDAEGIPELQLVTYPVVLAREPAWCRG